MNPSTHSHPVARYVMVFSDFFNNYRGVGVHNDKITLCHKAGQLPSFILIIAVIFSFTVQADENYDHTPKIAYPINDTENTDNNENKLSDSRSRELYTEAREALEQDDLARYNTLKKALKNYPLAVYLEYRELSKKLSTLPYREVDSFLENNKNTYLENLLLRRWLSQLASVKHWHEYRSYYSTHINSVAHQCLFLWSRLKTGDTSAFDEVAPLWNINRSQVGECDPVFQEWRRAGHLNNNLLWQRYTKVALTKHFGLRNFLRRQMPQHMQNYARQFERVLSKPSQLNTTTLFQTDINYQRIIVIEGMRRYIRRNADNAAQLWQQYDKIFQFNNKENNSFFYQLARRHAFDNKPNKLKPLLDRLNETQQTAVIEAIIRETLSLQQWQKVNDWITRLPATAQESSRWRYWQARSNEALKLPKESYQNIYTELAKQRSFYGFLSADYLSQGYELQHQAIDIPNTLQHTLEKMPSFTRARELFLLGKLHDARQEWGYGIHEGNSSTSGLEFYQAAAQIAHRWGWHRKAIESMATATTWNDLDIRFPIAHQSIIKQEAKKTDLPASLILAITRQESAWESDARSHAGAIGLMQIMPRTAKETAKKAGIRHRTKDLLKPAHNIILGSRYMSGLLKQYNNNRIPAIAAYNAGPSRVNRWLKNTGNQLPQDIWIEVIPFKETRKYVQNVLSYAVVYDHHLGKKTVLLSKIETGAYL